MKSSSSPVAHRKRLAITGVIFLAVLGAIFFGLGASSSSFAPVKLSDGTYFQLEGITLGTNHSYPLRGPGMERLVESLPNAVIRMLGIRKNQLGMSAPENWIAAWYRIKNIPERGASQVGPSPIMITLTDGAGKESPVNASGGSMYDNEKREWLFHESTILLPTHASGLALNFYENSASNRTFLMRVSVSAESLRAFIRK
jgi:hypothetical protein